MSTKLYPPQIAGALPAFCKTYDILQDLSVGARITIPFVMNAGVGEAEVKGFALRLKTSSSNTYICPVLYSNDWDKEKSTVTFEIGAEYANALNEGQYYKVQLAYYTYKTEMLFNQTTGEIEETVIDATSYDDFIIGYYSTVGIIKCISRPKITIKGYSSDSVNLFTGTFLGVYDQSESPDKTEKVYSYRFDFYDLNDELKHTSGELIHNINDDSDYNYSSDRYVCNDFIQPTEVYKLVYTVTTMNGYVGTSPKYKVTANTRLAPGRYMEVVTTPVIEDGCIDVSFKGELGLNAEGKMDEALYYGEFILSRASEDDGYVEWEQIQEFRLSNQKPSSFHFYDFSVKQGTKYIYSVQQFNMSKLYSTRILSPIVSVDFEDMFLFDGERSLKIRFNPKVSSFKTTHLEKKIETIGGKYPFIFRNGAVGYKEFPVEGLISYHIDENQRFFTREELYNFYRMNEETRKKADSARYITYHRNTDLTEDNILLERKFKLAVLDWLNNGEPKLFKSATEGNYIVRLINVSLSPEDTLGRMLHTFKSTAIEIADCTLSNLKKYGFSIGGAINSFVPLWRTYDFNKLENSLDGRGKELTFDQEVTSFKIEGVLPRTKVYIYYFDSPIPEEIIIGATGAYAFSGSSRRVTKLLFIFENDLNIQGQIECEYIGRRYSNFDAITNITLKTIISNQTIGVNPAMGYMLDSDPQTANFPLAVKALADTNYRTHLNKYLTTEQIKDALNGDTISVDSSGNKWKSLLNDLDLLEEKVATIKRNTSFDPSDTIQYIKTDFHDYERSKLSILNMEQARLRQRELIPVYVVPYEMVTPEAWKKMPDIIYKSRTDKQDNLIVCGKEVGKYYYSRENYERVDFPTWELMFSTTPFGRPYPLDELITYLSLQIKTYEKMIDKHFIYIIYKYNRELDEWLPIDNHSYVAPAFGGSYYDPYHKELLENYETTFYINEKYRYDPIGKEDVIKYNDCYILKSDNTIISKECLYIKDGSNYISAYEGKGKYDLWSNVKDPEYYYFKHKNNIDIKYSKEMLFEQLGEVQSFGISNGIIAEQTFQLQMMDYYTEVNDAIVAKAKKRYQDAYAFLNNVFKMFDNIEQADVQQYKFGTLYETYNLLLAGCEAGKHPLDAYDILLLFILLEKEEISTSILRDYFLPRLEGPSAPPAADITINLKRLIGQYQTTTGSVPIEVLLQDMFYTENDAYKQSYNNRRNVFTIIYNQINKLGELKLIAGEEEDILGLLTDEKITGLDSKYLSLQKMYDLIAAEIDAKEAEVKELSDEFSLVQNNVKQAYEDYNTEVRKIAVVEWIKKLYELNSSLDILDFLTKAEKMYSIAAENVDMESQYDQEQIDKWKGFYRTNYNTVKELVAEISVLEKIKADNNDDADLDSYLQKQINEYLKQIIILASQMEIIETTKYNNEFVILTPDELEEFSDKKLEIKNDLNYLYTDLVQPKLETLQKDINAGLKGSDTIEDSNIKLIELVQEFVLEADNFELFLGFTNWSEDGEKVFDFPPFDEFQSMMLHAQLKMIGALQELDVNDPQYDQKKIQIQLTYLQTVMAIQEQQGSATDWRTIRDMYIKMLSPLQITNLDRNILRINNNGNIFDGELITTNENYYLFSKETNIKEYKKRLEFLLTAIRDLKENKNKGIGDTFEGLIGNTNSVVAYQLGNFPDTINASKVEPINNAIDEVNNIIVKYVGLLHGSDKAKKKWDELIEEFNSVYPFDSYIVAEPENYKNKINNAKLFETEVFNIAYDKEIPPTEDTTQGTEIVYLIDGKTILPAPREVNEFTFTLTYRYFSDFYQKLVGEINGEGGNGMLWWYLDVVLRGEIEYQRSVLADMKKLLEEYQIKISDYSTKKEKYKEQYDNAVLIFDQYRIEFKDVFNYYYSNAGDQYMLIDQAIQNVKNYWNLFILELDLGYQRELERGMYG